MLLEFFWRGMNKEEVIHSLDKILEQQGGAELFIAEKHENLIVFPMLIFTLIKIN